MGAGILGIVCAASVTIGSAGAAPEENGQHCTVNVGNKEEKCFSTPEAAQEYAAVRIKDDALGAQTEVALPTDVVIGTLFKDYRYGGGSITLWGSRPCGEERETGFYFNLPDDWKGQVSSVQGWAECEVTLYSRPYLDGVASPRFADLTPVLEGQWNDYAESIEFR
ncbi:hypothetical protein DN051_41265 (plasmid) [Streptomyces cadmiisoli]|uniref:Peptidase inhibitor family I36 protein n=2 Tax=Streptomyces TaxID=1883 RepID=A0A2Z4JDD0_9ACTN|nr:hypothetical protein DN051_41265 [Streptomyces cadmiisoli]